MVNFHFLDIILTYAGRNCISKMFAALILDHPAGQSGQLSGTLVHQDVLINFIAFE